MSYRVAELLAPLRRVWLVALMIVVNAVLVPAAAYDEAKATALVDVHVARSAPWKETRRRPASVGYACPEQRSTTILQPLCGPKSGRGRGKFREIPASADVAQLVEHFTRNEGVRGSSPRVGLKKAPG